MSMKTKPKARVMWANYHPMLREPVVHATKQSAENGGGPAGIVPVRVAVIPLCDTEAIVDRAAKVLFEVNGMGDWEALHETAKLMWRHSARAVLTAAGIPCKRKARK